METLEDFIDQYPGIDVGEIEACYSSCQGKIATDSFEAYRHVSTCIWCRQWRAEQSEIGKRSTPSERAVKESIRKLHDMSRSILAPFGGTLSEK